MIETVQEETLKVFEKAKRLIQQERDTSLELVKTIGQLERMNAVMNSGIQCWDRYLKKLGLTKNQYWKRAQAARVIRDYPHFEPLLREGKVRLTQLSIIAPKITAANEEVFFDNLAGRSTRETLLLKKQVNFDGTLKDLSDEEAKIDLIVRLSQDEVVILERCREVLSARGKVPSDGQVVVSALQRLLREKDPVEKAQRSTLKRKGKREAKRKTRRASSAKKEVKIPQVCRTRSRHIPNAVRDAVILRDGGQCTFKTSDGHRCPEKQMLELDHIEPYGHNGAHTVENLRLLCRYHNRVVAEQVYSPELIRQMAELQREARREVKTVFCF